MIVLFARRDATGLLEERLAGERQRFERRSRRDGDGVFVLPDVREAAVYSKWPEVARAHGFDGTYGLVTRAFKSTDTVVRFGDCAIGGGHPIVIGGPCSVESRKQIDDVADAVRDAGAHGLRGGAFKPRTSPYAFQGMGDEGLRLLAAVRERTGLPIVTEVMTPEDIPSVTRYADMLQVGTRNMQNFRLLEAVGRASKPVLLKRGMMATIDEFLAAAEYVYLHGNEEIVLCERGIRTFEPRLRNTLDLGAVALLKRLTHLPVMVDPSHGTGMSEIVPDLSRAAIALGADGLLVEVHPRPAEALSDGPQSLMPEEFSGLMADLRALATAIGRPLATLGAGASASSTS